MLRHLYNHEKNIRNLPESETNRSFDTTNEVNRSSTIAVKIPIDRLLWCSVHQGGCPKWHPIPYAPYSLRMCPGQK